MNQKLMFYTQLICWFFWNKSFLNSAMPLSVIRVKELPKVAYMCDRYASTAVQADLSGIVIAVGKFVIQHMHISTNEFPLRLVGWKGPVNSQTIELNGLLGGFMWTYLYNCFWRLCCLQVWQFLMILSVAILIPYQKNCVLKGVCFIYVLLPLEVVHIHQNVEGQGFGNLYRLKGFVDVLYYFI